MQKPPCKKNGVDCPKRTIGCHSSCKEYIEYAEENERRREEIHKRKEAERNYCDQIEKRYPKQKHFNNSVHQH